MRVAKVALAAAMNGPSTAALSDAPFRERRTAKVDGQHVELALGPQTAERRRLWASKDGQEAEQAIGWNEQRQENEHDD